MLASTSSFYLTLLARDKAHKLECALTRGINDILTKDKGRLSNIFFGYIMAGTVSTWVELLEMRIQADTQVTIDSGDSRFKTSEEVGSSWRCGRGHDDAD